MTMTPRCLAIHQSPWGKGPTLTRPTRPTSVLPPSSLLPSSRHLGPLALWVQTWVHTFGP